MHGGLVASSTVRVVKQREARIRAQDEMRTRLGSLLQHTARLAG